MTSRNQIITAYAAKDNTQNASDVTFPVTVHAAPAQGWYHTNNLARATVHKNWRALQELSKMSVIKDLSVIRKKKKIIEVAKNYVGLFCPVDWTDLKGNRSKQQVAMVNAMVLDIDGVTPDVTEDILSRLSDMCYIAYTSISHRSPIKDGLDAFRIIIPLDRPCTINEYKTVWDAIEQCIPENDIQTKDPSRLWFLPSARIDREQWAWTRHNNGYALCVDSMLQYKATPTPTTDNGNMAPNISAPSRDSDHADGRYTIAQVPDSFLINGHDGVTRPFSEYIKDWKLLPKNRSGNYVCIAQGSETLGSAFISRKTDLISGLARYRITEQNSNRRNLDCIISDGGIELTFGNRGGSWSAVRSADNIAAMIGMMGLEIWECEIRQKPFLGSEAITDAIELEIMSNIRKKYSPGS